MRLSAPFMAIVFVLPVLCSFQEKSTGKEDLGKINDYYRNLKKYSLTLTYNFYQNYAASLPYQTEKASVQKLDNKQTYKIATIETLINDKYYLAIDHRKKIIIVEDAAKNRPKSLMPVNIDSAFRLCKSVAFLDKGDNISVCSMKFNTSEYESVEFYYNNVSSAMQKIVFYYREAVKMDEQNTREVKQKPRMEVVFMNLNTAPDFNDNTFSETRFIKGEGNKFTCQSKYNSYELINGLDKPKK